jgi:hypothetical protein
MGGWWDRSGVGAKGVREAGSLVMLAGPSMSSLAHAHSIQWNGCRIQQAVQACDSDVNSDSHALVGQLSSCSRYVACKVWHGRGSMCCVMTTISLTPYTAVAITSTDALAAQMVHNKQPQLSST